MEMMSSVDIFCIISAACSIILGSCILSIISGVMLAGSPPMAPMDPCIPLAMSIMLRMSSSDILLMVSAAILAIAGSNAGAPEASAMLRSCSSLIPCIISETFLSISGFSETILFTSSSLAGSIPAGIAPAEAPRLPLTEALAPCAGTSAAISSTAGGWAAAGTGSVTSSTEPSRSSTKGAARLGASSRSRCASCRAFFAVVSEASSSVAFLRSITASE
mmetsp:Transcript_21207/g.59701  ORF Transcript_21207/g.59701 Transcript_21207/m.59701 type:complete len:219 (-) Transcript_21207:569-1225(-)